jgi:hypothetical protein
VADVRKDDPEQRLAVGLVRQRGKADGQEIAGIDQPLAVQEATGRRGQVGEAQLDVAELVLERL